MSQNQTLSKSFSLSIVIPCFNEEGNVNEISSRLKPILNSLTNTWEIILVDDGSKDCTWENIIKLNNETKNIKGIRLSRNFGHQYALAAGMQHAIGDAVITMDGDLQHPPELLPKLINQWKAGNKIVNTIRLDPEEFGLIKRITSKAYYRVFSFLSGVHLNSGMADFRLIDRQVVNELSNFHEEGLFFRGLVQWVGFKSTNIEFQCDNRFSGTTKYSFLRMIKFAWHGVSSFSIVPLRIGILIGLLTSLTSFLYLCKAVATHFLYDTTVPGWTSTVGILSFLFGILFIFLGLIGEYIGRILVQVRSRPLYIVVDKTDME